jgi:peptidoglycan/LPS O-acetylase OafA/YrhL
MRARNPIAQLVLAVVLVAGAIAALVAILTGDLFEDELNSQLLGCAFIVGLAYFAASPALLLLDQGRQRGLGLATVALAALAIVLGVIAVFSDTDDYSGTITKLAGTVLVLAAVAGAASAMAHRRRDGDPTGTRVLSAAAVALAAVAGLFAIIPLWSESDDVTLLRAFGASLIVALVLGALAQVPRRAGTSRHTEPSKLTA